MGDTEYREELPLPVSRSWLSEWKEAKNCIAILEEVRQPQGTSDGSLLTVEALRNMLSSDDEECVHRAIVDALNAAKRLTLCDTPCSCFAGSLGAESFSSACSDKTKPLGQSSNTEHIASDDDAIDEDEFSTSFSLDDAPESMKKIVTASTLAVPHPASHDPQPYALDIFLKECFEVSKTSEGDLGGSDSDKGNTLMKPAPPTMRHVPKNHHLAASFSSPSQSTASLCAGRSIQELAGEMMQRDGSIIICDYELIDELGRGSFGIVNLAVDVRNEDADPVAIKTMQRKPSKIANRANCECEVSSHSTVANDHRLDIIEREIALMKRLRHKNLVRLHAVIEDKGNHEVHLVMQYIDNGPIAKLNRDATCTPVPIADALHYMVQVSAGIDYLHKHNILHRDVKPENILIDRHRNAYVADFGVSSLAEDICNKNSTQAAGTVPFFSPELCSEKEAIKQYGKQCDVWAFGVTLFVIIYGKLPFTGWNQFSLIRSIINDPPAFPADRPDVPELIVSLIEGLLEKNPQQRLTLRQFRNAVSKEELAKLSSTGPTEKAFGEFKQWRDSDSDNDSCIGSQKKDAPEGMPESTDISPGIVSGIVSFRKRNSIFPPASVALRPSSCSSGRTDLASGSPELTLTRSLSSTSQQPDVVKKVGKGFVHTLRNLRNSRPSQPSS